MGFPPTCELFRGSAITAFLACRCHFIHPAMNHVNLIFTFNSHAGKHAIWAILSQYLPLPIISCILRYYFSAKITNKFCIHRKS